MDAEVLKNISEESIDYKRKSRKLNFIIYLLFVLGFSSVSYAIIFGSSWDDEILTFVFFDTVLISVLLIYKYLRPRPEEAREHAVRYYKENTIEDYQDAIDAINYIEETFLLLEQETDYQDLSEIKNHIENKLYEIPDMDDFIPLDKINLVDRIKFSLFKQSLRRVKLKYNRLLVEKKDKLNNRTKDEVSKNDSLDKMLKLVKFATARLNNEVEQLSRKGDIYIIFGSAITLVAGGLLYIIIQDLVKIDENLPSGQDISSHDIFGIIMRLSIVVFVEIFAFYYLRLYKSIMDNVKFYQNEITNIEMKILALYAVENNVERSDINSLIEELSKTERNFVIDKNKTTVDLERSKVDSSSFNDSLEKIAKVFSSIKK